MSIYRERRQKLVDFLKICPDHKYYQMVFGTFNRHYGTSEDSNASERLKDPKDGFCGCALGHCTHLFPDDWKYKGHRPLTKDHEYSSYECASKFFGIDRDMAIRIFGCIGSKEKAIALLEELNERL